MKYIIASEYGICPSNEKGLAAKLSEFLNSLSEDSTVVLSPGRYYLEESIKITGLKNVNIKAYGVTFVTHFNPTSKRDACKGGLFFENCEDINIFGMKFDNDNPVNIYGRITDINLENNTFDVRLEEGCNIRGDEYIMCLDTCDENRSPNFHIFFCDFEGYKYEKTNENTLRFYIWHTMAHHLKNASIGELILMKHSLYAGPPLKFNECRRVLIEDVTVLSTPGHCCGVYPRSEDFTFRRFNVRMPYGRKQLCCSQTDGLHIDGLTGKLLLEDCHFEDMGDDALNIHNRAGTIFKMQDNILLLGLRRPENSLDELPIELLSTKWAKKGDVVYVYDEITLEKKGEFTVVDFGVKDGFNYLCFEECTCELHRGMKLANSAYYASVEIKNCSVIGSRARGFLIQSENILIEDCKFDRISSASILLACDVDYWNEMGPVNNVIIRNNLFEGCGTNYNDLCSGGITINMNHRNISTEDSDKFNVHHNVTIKGNKFVNMKDSAIFANAVTGISITGNEINNCATNRDNKLKDSGFDVVLFNCDEIEIDSNFSFYGKEVSINNKCFKT